METYFIIGVGRFGIVNISFLQTTQSNQHPGRIFCRNWSASRLQSMGSLKLGYDWASSLSLFTFMHWRRKWQPAPVFLPGKSHGQRSLVGCSPWGREESGTTEQLHFHFSLSFTGEGNGNPLQCSCLENPRDGGAWWAAVYDVAQSQTRLKWLSSSSNTSKITRKCTGSRLAKTILKKDRSYRINVYYLMSRIFISHSN